MSQNQVAVYAAIAGMGSNATDASIVRAGKSLKKHVAIQNQFDRDNSVPTPSGKSDKDRATIIEQLVSAEVFKVIPDRSFGKLNEHMYDVKDFRSWMENQMQKRS